MNRQFDIPTQQEISEGEVTDEYFNRTENILKKEGKNPDVVTEIKTSQSHVQILAGLKDAAQLLKDTDVTMKALPEGGLIGTAPIIQIEGPYLEFCRYEAPILGFLSHASGVATDAAFIKAAALSHEDPPNILSFGTRRIHPSSAAMIERSAYIGGVDGVSNIAGAEIAGLEPKGTMPHALVLSLNSAEDAWEAYNKNVPSEVPRIMLCDTFSDEVEEVKQAVDVLGPDLDAVRLDTTSSRRGDFEEIIREVKWELRLLDREDVDIFVSGGIGMDDVEELGGLVDGFGVGGGIANADPVDFSMNIVEVDGEAVGKRGVKSGRKLVVRERSGPVVSDRGMPLSEAVDLEGVDVDEHSVMEPVVEDGVVVRDFCLEDARDRGMSVARNICEFGLGEGA